MAKPRRNATCHPDRPHKALGWCNNCYKNHYNSTSEGRQKRRQFYIDNKAKLQEKARARWRDLNPEVKRVHGIKANEKRSSVARHRSIISPRLTAIASTSSAAESDQQPGPSHSGPGLISDKDWWKLKEIPRHWL